MAFQVTGEELATTATLGKVEFQYITQKIHTIYIYIIIEDQSDVSGLR